MVNRKSCKKPWKALVKSILVVNQILRRTLTNPKRDESMHLNPKNIISTTHGIWTSIREIIEETALKWGVEVESMLIKDLIFSQELQDSLSMAAQSKRTGEAKVIAARAEVESAKLMRQAADILSSAPAMQIRYLEAMQAMAKSSQSKVIFMPGPANAGELNVPKMIDDATSSSQPADYNSNNSRFQAAINSHAIEHM